MKAQLFFLCLLVTGYVQMQAQTVQGTVLHAETQEALPFVTIGIPGKGIGTVAQADGSFTLRLDDALPGDTIRISMIGFATEWRKAGDWKNQTNIQITLSPLDQQLEALVVRPTNRKTFFAGNDFDKPFVQVGFVGDAEDTTVVNPPGAELGTIMRVKKNKKHYLDSCGINMSQFTPDSAILRINFYQIVDDEPSLLLNTKPVYATLYKGQSKLVIDLRPYNITADNDFVMAIEWLVDLKGKQETVLFCGGFVGAGIRYREVSEGKWKKAPIGIAMWCAGERDV